MENKNYGFIAPTIKPEDYILGAGKIPEEVLQDNANWLNFLPLFEIQKKGTETWNCTAFGTTSALEILIKRKLGEEKNYSDRALGIMAGTTPPGNDPNTVIETLRKQGLVKEASLPFSDDLTSPEAYFSPKPLPNNLIEEAKEFLNEFEILHEWVWSYGIPAEEKHKRLKEALKYSPIGISVYAWESEDGVYVKRGEDNHWCVLYGYDELLGVWLIYDSYENNLKMLHKDFDFSWAKRYWIAKKPKIEITAEKKKKFSGFVRTLRDFWQKIKEAFGDRTFGVARNGNWGKVRAEFLKENPLCAVCGKKGNLLNPLNVHHKKLFNRFPELELDKKNLIVLCRDDHFLFGHYRNWKCQNNEVEEDAKEWSERIKNRV